MKLLTSEELKAKLKDPEIRKLMRELDELERSYQKEEKSSRILQGECA